MRLPEALEAVLTSALGIQIKSVQTVGGGDINQAAQITTNADQLFLKWHARSPDGMFTAEARGLELLRQAGTLRVPEVVAYQEHSEEAPAYMVLEWLERGRPEAGTYDELGRGLAQLHQVEASAHGLDHDNFIGRLPQYNQQETSWTHFYAEHRIRPQMEIARRSGKLTSAREKLIERLLDKLPNLLPADNPPASLLHGDLWSGNVMTLAGGQPAIIDPAVYYGHREVEIAFTELFGGFRPQFYEAYNAIHRLDKGYEERRSLYQLYPLMVHMNLFGGGYTGSVDSILRRYAGS